MSLNATVSWAEPTLRSPRRGPSGPLLGTGWGSGGDLGRWKAPRSPVKAPYRAFLDAPATPIAETLERPLYGAYFGPTMIALLTALAAVSASVPATGEHFRGQADHSVILMESREGVRCAGRVPELDREGMADVVIRCNDGRSGLVKLRVDDEGIGIGYGSLAGRPMELTILG